MSPDSQLKYLKPGRASFDPLLLDFVAEFVRRESVVWDVGANVGVLSLAAAHLATAGHALAIEPDPFLAHALTKTRMDPRNADLRLEILQAAVADRRDVLALGLSLRGRARNSLVMHSRDAAATRARIHVPTVTLDELTERFAPPTVLKIDVEGAESAVLAGATDLLRRHRPVILIEVGVEATDRVTQQLRDAGYSLRDAGAAAAERRPLDCCSFNTLALPA